jgi:hypothetical protein
MKKIKTFWVLLPFLVLTLAACSSGVKNQAVSEVESPQKEQDNTAAPLPAATEHEEAVCEDPFGGSIPAFRTDGWKTNFCLHSVDYESLFSGGPPRDGIPPIDSPRFESIESADEWIEELEPVILLDYEGEVRAYPLQILTWHEIVNDEVAGDPIVITYCPLCNTALVFLRPTIDGELLTFGTSGNLRYSDLVMWDRQTESWWQQFTGEAIVGDLTGTKLESIPVAIISWVDFKSKYPDAQVLSIETGFQRSYGRNPYAGYDNITSQPFAFVGDLDVQLPAMARVVGISPENGAGGAFSLDLLSEKQVLNEKLGEVPVVLFWKSGTASALDSGSIADGRDVGTTGVFSAQIDDQELTFSALEDGLFLDQETGSTWDIFGDAIDGPLAGSSLDPIPHHDTFWFAWAVFVPDSELNE